VQKLFEKKAAKDVFWKLIECIQSCVKDKVGIGKPILVQFFAPLDESVPDYHTIDFSSFKKMPDDLQLLNSQLYQEFAYK
jgi:hypothetical protein